MLFSLQIENWSLHRTTTRSEFTQRLAKTRCRDRLPIRTLDTLPVVAACGRPLA